MRTFIIAFTLISLTGCKSSVSNEQQHEPGKPNTADTTLQYSDTVAKIKFIPPVTFADFKTDTFTGTKSAIDYKSSKTARRFKTVITQTYNENELMFGGHYSFAAWGCGTACHAGALVDLTNGKVYDLPTASLGYEYRKDSRLLILNPPDSLGFYEECGYCTPELWIWDDSKKKFEQYGARKN